MTERVHYRIARAVGAALLALWMLAALHALADPGAVATEDALTAALLKAITEGHWWAALAAAGALTIGILRRQGLIRVRWLAAVASIALAVAGGVVHHWLAGVPMGLPMLVTAVQIAVPMVLALVIPPQDPDPSALSERS